VDRAILRVLSGRSAYQSRVLSPGESVRVGRAPPPAPRIGLVIDDDTHLSADHFTVTWAGGRCTVLDDGSVEGTLVDGEKQARAEAHHGTWIRAGRTDFAVYFEGATAPPGAGVEIGQEGAAALAAIQAEPYPLFAVADASRDARVLVLLRESVDRWQSLFEGAPGRAADEQAPYLVELRDDSELCERLVAEGWGRRWASYLTSRRPFKEVRTHLRRLLMVEDEETGEQMYFRFYDPAVLRVFLSAAGRRHRETVFDAIASFVLEDERGEPRRFVSTG
jgi:hypothetical protein